MNRDLTGPALDGAFGRVQDHYGFSDEETTEWLIAWIKNSAVVIANGDDYANSLFKEWNSTAMNAFISTPDEDVLAVIDYIQYWNDPVKYPVIDDGEIVQNDTGKSTTGISPNLILIILVLVLLIIALVLARLTNVLGRIAKEKEGEEVPEEQPFYLNKNFLTVILIIGVVALGFTLVDGAINLGRQQGYAPTQPIAFSHKLHAGINQIDCKYCHYGAERGKQAIIPSPSICMNCHKFVEGGPDANFKANNGLAGPGNDSSEIAKIYTAVGWDKETQTYDATQAKPIEWIRIHNLPDHVYFNHSQHVKIGELECQECHGPIEEMDKVEQFAPLSMGWCINCHRTKQVKFTENAYYEGYFEKYHEKMKDGNLDGVTVEMIGGTDCQKCHY